MTVYQRETVRRRQCPRRGKNKRKARTRLFWTALLPALAVAMWCGLQSGDQAPPRNNLDAPCQIAHNRTALTRSKEDIRYIVIHDTANKSRGADAENHFAFFNRENQASSADFFVDDEEILQVNDYYRYYTWHCGDGQGRQSVTNRNSIGVEICINRDGNYKKATQNAVYLVKRLMTELSVDADHVVRHYDASGKACPGSMAGGDWKKWQAFQKAIRETE